MCRIATITHFGKERISPAEVKSFLLNMEAGGKDATGIAFVDKERITFSKYPGSASNVISPRFEEVTQDYINSSHAIILHTRSATHGSPLDNKNNHPLFGKKYMLVHNGIVSLDEKFSANGETDSEQLLLAMEKYGIKKGLEKASGWASIIWVNYKTRDKVYFYKGSFGSLVGAIDDVKKIFILASTKNIILNSYNSKDLKFFEIKPEMVYCIDFVNKEIKSLFEAKMKQKVIYSYGYKFAEVGDYYFPMYA